ncbi:hypothetical protein QBC46DRAFT_462783 [Diplogelasinospora grovesii]|uniref:Uncharacterized protein n=1 Tax=Diplogelasinospora grovesii TaxID=303347 RepID=A0AAN6RZF4_9PEZI|nr:hypothetical protein QBC46DRAFT_462783 [Diplogelasinospora grovesii]
MLTDDTTRAGISPATTAPAQRPEQTALPTSSCREIISAMQALVPTLIPDKPIFATFHDGQVHDPLGGGSYAFQNDIIGPVVSALMNDEALLNGNGEKRALNTSGARLPTRPIHPCRSTAQQLASRWHACRIRDRMHVLAANAGRKPPPVSVEMTFVDTAPVKGQGVEIGGIQYQRSYRENPGAFYSHLGDYQEVLHLLSACQNENNVSPSAAAAHDATITFHCPHHGPHTICVSNPADVARLEANAPLRNLIRSMSHLLDASAHHVRITGADYAGMYQEAFLYRPLAAWAAATGMAAGRTPHILYSPLIVDWSSAKLSKSLYVREGGYKAMKLLGTDGLCSLAELKRQFNGNGAEGLKAIWEEVEKWVKDPKKLFRTFSVEYLQRIIMKE